GRLGRINAVFVTLNEAAPQSAEAFQSVVERSQLFTNEALRGAVTLEDLHIKLVRNEDRGTLSVESDRMILDPSLVKAIQTAAANAGLSSSPRYVALANEITPADATAEEMNGGQRRSAYFVVAGVETDHQPAIKEAGDGLILNQFLANDQLNVPAGPDVLLKWSSVDDGADAPELSETFPVAAVVPLEGAAADGTLTPTVKGITDAESFNDWDQPFEMNLDRVTTEDENYWDDYRALPKAFLPLDRMRELFPSRYGESTSVLLSDREGGRIEDFDAAEERFATELIQAVDLRSLGLALGPVKAQGLAAAAGTTDFAGLFVGFSLFLILSAAILIALLFR
ncbi:MAG: hypothetical protein AAF907_18235, partial [Planctomycetota bacterium]